MPILPLFSLMCGVVLAVYLWTAKVPKSRHSRDTFTRQSDPHEYWQVIGWLAAVFIVLLSASAAVWRIYHG